jgi:CheY-like chemotaxis protein
MTAAAPAPTKGALSADINMLNGRTILVVEEEFLIALDIQRILETHGTGQMLFARTAEEAHDLEAHWPSVGLAIVEIRHDGAPSLALVRRLRDAGVAVVLNTVDSALRRGHPEFPDVPVAVKPMAEEDLLAAIEQAVVPRMNGCES